LSLKRVIEALVSLGLSRTEARIYVFLEKSGSHNDVNISQALKLCEKELIRSLKNLQDKRLVKASAQHAVEFSAVPFEKAINLLIEVKKEQAQSLQQRKMELLSSWQNLTKKNSENN
jgi:HTH-type transcriptional regulator, sugar sensing transcriptional regulator